MKKIFYILLLIVLISVTEIKAQDGFFSLQYSIGLGSGNVKDYINQPSFRGIGMEYRYFLQSNLSMGIESGYNLFYDRMDYATYTVATESITGVQYRYLHAVPILGEIDYYLKPDTKLNPFVGLGVGTIYTHKNIDMGMFTIEDDSWQFALRPQVGFLISTNSLDFIVGAKYFTGFKTDNAEAHSYFTLNFGLIF